jgi:hypothetical protein
MEKQISKEAIESFVLSAYNAGSPKDQVEGFLTKKYIPLPWQWKFHSLARSCDKEGGPTEIGVGGARGPGKQLSIDTEIPTPTGFATMGEIKVGDIVLSSSGIPIEVMACTPIDYKADSYEIKFDSGETIKADGRHLWLTKTADERASDIRRTEEFRSSRRKKRLSRSKNNPKFAKQSAIITKFNKEKVYSYKNPSIGSIRTTEEIYKTLRCQKGRAVNHSIENTQPIDFNEASLLIEPYLFGLWLGDGYSKSGVIGMCEKDIDTLRSFLPDDVRFRIDIKNRKTPFKMARIPGMTTKLRDVGVYGNKHIPMIYKRASFLQRLSLLQGMMDTDGSVSKKDGGCELGFSNKNLIQDALEIITSLGIKARIISKRAKIYGRDVGETYRIIFTPRLRVFRLLRKLSIQKQSGFRSCTNRRFIVSVEKIKPVPMRCIQVSSQDGMYLVGRTFIPTHNSHCVFAQVGLDDCQRFSNLKGLFLRKTGKAARESFEDLIFKVLSGKVEYNYNPSNSLLKFANGSKMVLGGFETENDIDKYIGIEYDFIAIEELNQLSKDKVDRLLGSLRTSRKDWRPRTYNSFNPGGRGHCVPFGEVLTKEGWKDISKINIGNDVLTLSDNNELVFVPVSQKTIEDYDGEIIKSENWSAKFECTPEHKIVRITETKSSAGRKYHSPSLIKLKNIPNVVRLPKIGNWHGKEIKSFSISCKETRKKKKPQPLSIGGNDYCELMGWFLSEGCTLEKYGFFSIAQSKQENRVKIKKLLKRCGFVFGNGKEHYTIYSRSWVEYLKKFGKCRDKFVPQEIKNSTSKQINIFLKSAFLGDGCGNRYYTTSKRLADDMCELALKVGKRPYLSSRQRINRKGLSYDISFKSNKIGWIEKKNNRIYKFSGKVYCLGIEKLHRFYLRQNGTVWLSGNSFCKEKFVIPYRENRETRTRFVPSTYKDNSYLNIEYIEYLEGLSGSLGKAWREGDWDLFEGQFFTEWDRNVHIIEPFSVPSTFRKFIGIDYGSTAPFVALWVAIDWDGNYYCYREYYKTGETAENNAKAIVNLMPDNERVEMAVADRSIFSKQGYGETIADILKRNGVGVPGTKIPVLVESLGGPSSRISRAQILKQKLYHKDGVKPKIRFFSTCFNIIRTIPELIYDEKHVEDIDGKSDDHAYDALTYLIQKLENTKTAKPLNTIEQKIFKMKQEKLHSSNYIVNQRFNQNL